mmetsp:Transcript_35587/g.75008  ORF Transcript_35587/g.75008 Transcript_35587/m.75008 type:complete len:146 (+) Transcript_35587:302-739(+)
MFSPLHPPHPINLLVLRALNVCSVLISKTAITPSQRASSMTVDMASGIKILANVTVYRLFVVVAMETASYQRVTVAEIRGKIAREEKIVRGGTMGRVARDVLLVTGYLQEYGTFTHPRRFVVKQITLTPHIANQHRLRLVPQNSR